MCAWRAPVVIIVGACDGHEDTAGGIGDFGDGLHVKNADACSHFTMPAMTLDKF